jgi:formylglycine-generating enzyme required for sulfatase activity
MVELPHEYEWEVAARWPDNRLYPWGNQFDATKANTREGNIVGQTTAAGLYPHGANPKLNLHDLSGNVWEWCRNKYKNPDNEEIDDSNDGRVLRGGSWLNGQDSACADYRSFNTPNPRDDVTVGFRVVVRRPPSHHDL